MTGDVVAQTGAYTKAGTIGGTEDVTITTRDSSNRASRGAAPTPTQRVFDGVRHFLVVVLVGALLIWFAPRAYAAMKASLRQRPVPSLGWGIVAICGFVVLLMVVLIVMLMLAIAFGLLGFLDLMGLGIAAGIVAMVGASLAFAVVAGYVADALVGVALASLVMRGENPSRWRELAVLAVGAAVVVLLSSLPVVGPWVKLVVILLGLGAVLLRVAAARGAGPGRRAGRIRPASAGATDAGDVSRAGAATYLIHGAGDVAWYWHLVCQSCGSAATRWWRWTSRAMTNPLAGGVRPGGCPRDWRAAASSSWSRSRSVATRHRSCAPASAPRCSCSSPE